MEARKLPPSAHLAKPPEALDIGSLVFLTDHWGKGLVEKSALGGHSGCVLFKGTVVGVTQKGSKGNPPGGFAISRKKATGLRTMNQ